MNETIYSIIKIAFIAILIYSFIRRLVEMATYITGKIKRRKRSKEEEGKYRLIREMKIYL